MAPEDHASAVAACAANARAAQTAWAATSIRARLAIIRRLRGLIAARADALVAAVGSRYDRTPAETLTAEIMPLAAACRFLEREAAGLLAPRRLSRRGRPLWLPGTRAEVRREAFGVVLVLAPGNYRLLLAGVQAIQALAAGNAVLVKPAPGASAPLIALRDLLREAGLPGELLQVLHDDTATGRAALAAAIDKVVLTGSAATGRAVLAELAPRLIPATLELSGDDAVFVLPGADLDRVADSVVWGMTLNAGATCIAPRRIYIAREQHAALESRLAARLAEQPPRHVDPEPRRRAIAAIEAAAAAGYRRLGGAAAGEWPADQTTIWPTLLSYSGADASVLPGDLFAPVAALIAVADIDAGVAANARCGYALGAAIFGPEDEARTLAGRINAGVVTVNDLIVPTADPRVAFGGRGLSGYGVTRGREGLLEMTRPKTVMIRRGRSRPHLENEQAEDQALFTAFLQLCHGRGLGVRLWALRAAIALIKSRG